MAKAKKTTKKTVKKAAPKRVTSVGKAGGERAAPTRAKPGAKRRVEARAPKKTGKAKAPASAARARPRPAAKGPKQQARRAPPRIEDGPTELDTIKLAYLFRDTTPSAIYRALMDAAEHSLFTGDAAEIDASVGGEFRSYGGFIHGTTLELVPDARIVQSWRTRHFPKNNPNSRLELTITPVAEGTRVDMRHIDVPKTQVEYIVSGWVKFYLDPLAVHLGKRVSIRPPPL